MFSFIIAHRSGSSERVKNLFCILDNVFKYSDKNIEVIVVEQDSKKNICLKDYPNCKHIFLQKGGYFLKSWVLNVGFRFSSGDLVGFLDNDILLTEDQFNNAKKELLNYEVVSPFRSFIDLTENESDKVRAGTEIDLTGRKPRPSVNFASGSIFFRRESFIKTRGWDESFVGWGGEDDAMAFFIIPLLIGRNKMKTIEVNAIHLWHGRESDHSCTNSIYKKNLLLLDWYRNTCDDIVKNVITIKGIDNIGNIKGQHSIINKVDMKQTICERSKEKLLEYLKGGIS